MKAWPKDSSSAIAMAPPCTMLVCPTAEQCEYRCCVAGLIECMRYGFINLQNESTKCTATIDASVSRGSASPASLPKCQTQNTSCAERSVPCRMYYLSSRQVKR
jgi:hypothetical protein